MTENGPSEKLDFSMPFCCILFTDSEYTTLFETPSILSELQPITVSLKYIWPKMVRRKSWIFLCHVVAFCSQIQNIQLFFETPSILSELQLKIELFSVKFTIQRLNTAKLNRLIFSSKPSCCTPGPVASDLMIKAFPFDQANSAYQVASFHTI